MSTTTPFSVHAERAGDYPAALSSSDHAPAVEPAPARWSDDEVDRYRRDGFLASSDVLTAAEVRQSLEGIADLTLDPRGADLQLETGAAERLGSASADERMDAIRRLKGFVGEDRRLLDIARSARLLTLVRQLAGVDDLVLYQDMALLKPPGGGREKPWHQDNAFFALEPGTPIVGVWIALDEATAGNGCMHVRPGSHLDGPRLHFRRRDWQLCDSDVLADRDDEAVTDLVVPLPPGGALFFDGLIHHGTPANRTGTRRRALQLHYVPAAAVPVSEARRLEVFGGEGAGATC